MTTGSILMVCLLVIVGGVIIAGIIILNNVVFRSNSSISNASSPTTTETTTPTTAASDSRSSGLNVGWLVVALLAIFLTFGYFFYNSRPAVQQVKDERRSKAIEEVYEKKMALAKIQKEAAEEERIKEQIKLDRELIEGRNKANEIAVRAQQRRLDSSSQVKSYILTSCRWEGNSCRITLPSEWRPYITYGQSRILLNKGVIAGQGWSRTEPLYELVIAGPKDMMLQFEPGEEISPDSPLTLVLK